MQTGKGGEQEMKARLCIHSDINRDDERERGGGGCGLLELEPRAGFFSVLQHSELRKTRAVCDHAQDTHNTE